MLSLLLPLFGPNNENQEKESPALNVEFIITIENRELSYWGYRGKIYDAAYEKLYSRQYDSNEIYQRSPVESYLRERINRRNETERFFIIVLDYNEREGSFIITLSLFAFTALMNYGSFRESLDYLVEDFRFFFKDASPANTLIDIQYKVTPNEPVKSLIYNLPSQQNEFISRQFGILKSLIALIGLMALGFSLYAIYKVENMQGFEYNDADLKEQIRNEIDDMNSRRVNEELLRLLHDLRADSSNTAR